jgi:hypothetical protein
MLLLSFILALFSATAAAPCDEAARCSCFWNPMEVRSEGLTARQLADADVVILATVSDSGVATPTTPDLYRLRVERWWKGGEGDTLTILRGVMPAFASTELPDTRLVTSCDYPFRVGEQYILYLRRGDDGWLRTDWCSGTTPRTSPVAESVIGQLDAATAGEPEPAADPAAREYVAGEALRRVPALERYPASSMPLLLLRSDSLAEEALARLAVRLSMRPLAGDDLPCPGRRGEIYHSVHFDEAGEDAMLLRVHVHHGGGHDSHQHEFSASREDGVWQLTHVRSLRGFRVCRSGGGADD